MRSIQSQDVIWPGVTAVESFEYTVNHGISPNSARLVTYPQTSAPAEFGNLSWSDGWETLTLADCHAIRNLGSSGPSGDTWVLEIYDERWRNRNPFGGLGGITGWYNRRDKRGELVPWTIRSPEELAVLCLKQMKARKWTIQLPPGLTSEQGKGMTARLFLGERFPPSGTNREVIWDHTPPAEALSQLAEWYGCRVVFLPFSREYLVVPLGKGKPLPTNKAIEVDAPNIELPQLPKAVGIHCDYVRVQMRFALEPVAKEWTGWPVPVDKVSYAPKPNGAAKQKSKVNFTGVDPSPALMLVVTWTDAAGVSHSVNIWDSDPAHTSYADILGTLVDRWTENAELSALGVAQLVNVGGTWEMQINGSIEGQSFDIEIQPYGSTTFPPYAHTVTEKVAPKGTATWEASHPPVFPNVRPTDRLSYIEAQALARESVFRWYRIKITNPVRKPSEPDKPTSPPPPSEVSTSWNNTTTEPVTPPKPGLGAGDPLWVPWYSEQFGPIERREQLILHSSKVEQVKPSPRIEGGTDKGNPIPWSVAQGILPESYTGYSRDQESTVTGSVYVGLGRVTWTRVEQTPVVGQISTPRRKMNTEPTDRVYVGFQIITAENGEQLVCFNEPVYNWNYSGKYGMYAFPELVLETSCYVRHPKSDQPIRWEEIMEIPGGTAEIEWGPQAEIKVGVVGEYDKNNNLTGWHYGEGDISYAKSAARHYLQGMAWKYQVKGGVTRHYPQILKIEPDGYVQQVSWSLSRNGPTTIASANTEHSPAWPDYPHRIRGELLPPNKVAAEANARERALVEKWSSTPNKPTV